MIKRMAHKAGIFGCGAANSPLRVIPPQTADGRGMPRQGFRAAKCDLGRARCARATSWRSSGWAALSATHARRHRNSSRSRDETSAAIFRQIGALDDHRHSPELVGGIDLAPPHALRKKTSCRREHVAQFGHQHDMRKRAHRRHIQRACNPRVVAPCHEPRAHVCVPAVDGGGKAA